MTGLIGSICAKLIRHPLAWDSQASINIVTARAESDLKPISHLGSKRMMGGKSSVPRSHILSTNNSVCVEQPNNSFFCSTCDCFYLVCSQASVIHFPTSSEALSPGRYGMIQYYHLLTSAGFIHKLPPGLRYKKAEPQIIEATRGSAVLMIPERGAAFIV